MAVIVTNHALMRAKERLHLKNQKTAERYFQHAQERGKSYKDYAGYEKLYLLNKENEGIYVRVHNSAIYIFSENWFAITVYPIPNWFDKTASHINRDLKHREVESFWCFEYNNEEVSAS